MPLLDLSINNDDLDAFEWEVSNVLSYGAFAGYDLVGQLVKKAQLQKISKDFLPKVVSYQDFPKRVRSFVKSYFHSELEQFPDLIKHLGDLKVFASQRPLHYTSDIGAEYFDSANIIASYIPLEQLFTKYAKGLVHEIVHSIQFYLHNRGQKVATPQKDDSRYYSDNKFYLNDVAEIEASRAEDSFDKLSWMPQPDDMGYPTYEITELQARQLYNQALNKIIGWREGKEKYLLIHSFESWELWAHTGRALMTLAQNVFEDDSEAQDWIQLQNTSSLKFSTLKDKNEQLFNQRYPNYGEDGGNLFWSDKQSQYDRFELLTDVMDLKTMNKESILDVGTGFGDYLDFLRDYSITVGKYVGIDIIPAIIEVAERKHPLEQFEVRDIIRQPYAENSFDYVIGSGLFALDDKDWLKETVDLLKIMYKVSRKAVAVNFLEGTSLSDMFKTVSEEEVKKIASLITDKFKIIKGKISDDITLYLYR